MKTDQDKKNTTIPLVTLTLLFFMWGFITCMNDILIPHLKELFSLSYLMAMLVQFCFFGAYFIGSLVYFFISYFYSDPINKIGYKNGILLGLLISAVGCVLFYPAAEYVQYFLFLSAFFILGLGFTLLQIAANPFVALLGDERTASGRLNLVQGFNSLGTTIAPMVGGYMVFELFAEGESISGEETKKPYLVFAAIFILLFVLVKIVKLPVFKNAQEETKGLGALKFPQLRMGALAIFCYVGAEVAIGSFLINFLNLPETIGVSEAVAKNYLALYWGGAMIGRFLAAISFNQNIPVVKKALYMFVVAFTVFLLIFGMVNLTFEQLWVFPVLILLNLLMFYIGKSIASRTLLLFATINVLLLILAVSMGGQAAVWMVLAIGLFNSVMWSNIFTLSISGLQEYTSQGSSLLVMAILGGAIVPLIQGAIADFYGLQISFLLPVLCYTFIAWFGYFCHKNKLDTGGSTLMSSGH
ncbi:sugar MFS transporter [Sphingobacterium haloxyli]|uniref:MFS transporter n=1 Tax=Sphingobacterium haloxyli TaxID=2100533 RepID=A0A2S9J7V7_9SPHI|nr:sugar MFS transporter [Sphingobacterium haloxyli]PRD48878.1 MFS transporter [Sphingobacterium haloxyli]